MHLAALAVLLAIGVPALQRGQAWRGGLCLGAASGIAAWWLWSWWRARR
jgi:hypothetical protein